MLTFVISLALFLVAFAGLAAGLFFGREPISGSCGGLACRAEGHCSACREAPSRGLER